MRRCKLPTCKIPIDSAAKSVTHYGKSGFCSAEHGAEYAMDALRASQERAQATERKKAREARAAERKAYRAAKRERKERLKTLSDHVSETQTLVNQVVVLEDKPKGCISCTTGEVTDAGHYFHRGSKYRVSPLTLDRRNLTGQCRHCNSYKGGGNQHEYRLGYIERYGQAQFDDLCEYKRMVDCGEIPKLTVDQCKQIQTWARARIKELKRQQ